MSKLRLWSLVFLAWSLAGLLYSLQSFHYRASMGLEVQWNRILLTDMGYFLFWALLSPPLLVFFGRWPIGKSNWVTRVPVHLLMALLVAFFQRGLYEFVFLPSRLPEGTVFSLDLWYSSTVGTFDFGVFVYLTLLFITHSVMYYRDLQQETVRVALLKSDLARAQLQSLRMQLQPHFFFNALNAVSGMIESKPEMARLTVGRLGELLRYTLEHGQSDEVSFRKELLFSETFLEIQKARFGERLTVTCDVDPETLDIAVPSLLMPPILENAIEYGIGTVPGPGYVALRAFTENGFVVIEVKNNQSASRDAHKTGGFGIGISNTRSRLSQLYGSSHKFTLMNEGDRCRVEIQIPVHDPLKKTRV